MLAGHLWTVADLARRQRLTTDAGASVPWSGEVEDPVRGRVGLSGWLERASDERLVVLLHGLGGSAQSAYLLEAHETARRLGLSVLRLNARGADRSGADLFHAGLTDDLRAALASPELADFGCIGLLGFSLGGHQALKAATEPQLDPRVRAVAAVSAPTDLDSCCTTIDLPSRHPYRVYLFKHLMEIYEAVAAKGEVPAPIEEVRRLRKFRRFDAVVVAGRFGFASAEDYYARESVGPRLGALSTPALYIGSLRDPMVPSESVLRDLERAAALQAHWSGQGGHVAFPKELDLGLSGPRGIYGQALAWLVEHMA